MTSTDNHRHPSLAAALAAMQAELPKLSKTETAKVTGEGKNGAPVKYTYGYAGLDQVVETVLPALGKHGLSVTSKTVILDGALVLEVSLLHAGPDKERETGYWPLPSGPRVGPQDLGSAMTYGRRYLTLALTGTFPGGEDDDGARAQQNADQRAMSPEQFDQLPRERPGRPANAPTSPAPANNPQPTPEQFRNWFGKLNSLPLDQVGKLYDWMGEKGLHDQESEGKTGTRVLVDRLTAALGNPQLPLDAIDGIRAFATERGLLNQQVAPDGTSLSQVIIEVRELAQHEQETGGAPAAADA